MSNILTNQFMSATLARFDAKRQEALATIELYLTRPVGVGEHPDIVGEIAGAVARLAEADEAIGAINRYFVGPEAAEEPSND